MLVTSSIEFNPETLDTSEENYIKLNYINSRPDDLSYYIIIKHLIKYLKDHPASRICEDFSTTTLLYTLKDMCHRHGRVSTLQEVNEFTTNKKLELDLIGDSYILRRSSLFEVWCYIDLILEQLEIRCERGDYGN